MTSNFAGERWLKSRRSTFYSCYEDKKVATAKVHEAIKQISATVSYAVPALLRDKSSQERPHPLIVVAASCEHRVNSRGHAQPTLQTNVGYNWRPSCTHVCIVNIMFKAGLSVTIDQFQFQADGSVHPRLK